MRKCLYHANCNDGIAAALIVWRAHPTMDADKDFVPVQYQQQPPWEAIDGHDVIMVDFSYKRPVIEEIQRRASSLLILDHHKSAERELAGLECAHFNMDKCGAVMAWEHFFSQAPKAELLHYIQDRDLWLKKLPDSDAVTMYLRSHPMTLQVWARHFIMPIEEMKIEGGAIKRWYDLQCLQLVEAWKAAPTYSDIGGHQVPVINVPGFMSSEVAGMLADGYPFAAVFFHVADGVVYSLRRRDGDVDLSKVAASYGGGGHPAAAAFKVPRKITAVIS